MKSTAKAWFQKARADAGSARRELRARVCPNLDSACFHAQQSVEKAINGAMEEHGVSIRKTHDLGELLSECPWWMPVDKKFCDDLELLSQVAVLFRYPGASATKAEAGEAVRAMERCWKQIGTGAKRAEGSRGGAEARRRGGM